jgi:ATP-dependent RNA helicase RhlE
MTFSELQLAEPVLNALIAQGYETPTPIQEEAIPPALEGRDVLGAAQTGTGKTAAFMLPVIHRLYTQLLASGGLQAAPSAELRVAGAPRQAAPSKWQGRVVRDVRAERPREPQRIQRPIRALVLAPTRELAVQITESAAAYARGTTLRTLAVFGGISQHPQVRQLQSGVDILVATPGRLLDLVDQGYIQLKHIEVLVLDEADRMLDMGFMPDLQRIVQLLPAQRQTLFFSATMPSDIKALADKLLTNPAVVSVTPSASVAETVDQRLYHVSKEAKKELLLHLLSDDSIGSALVFTKTKFGADKLSYALDMAGIGARAIHGDKTQSNRQAALNAFKRGDLRVLVATDVAARGIDVDKLSHVVNFDLPNQAETYVHRIGRTGRAGESGQAISFCDHEDRGNLRDIVRLLKRDIPVVTDHPYAVSAPDPSRSGPSRGGRSGGGYRGGSRGPSRGFRR